MSRMGFKVNGMINDGIEVSQFEEVVEQRVKQRKDSVHWINESQQSDR